MTTKSLDDLTRGVPAGPAVDPDTVAEAVRATRRVLVVLDDDPTGTQSVADLPVLTGWEVEDLAWAITQGKPAVYVMTNSRSLDPDEAERVNREVARNALAASARTDVPIGFVSRSDSTMRGHFPLEPRVLAEEWKQDGVTVDGVVVVPAFGDAGRITVHGVHYAGSEKDGFVPVGETEFAKDATFGYESSNLREWAQEKSGGQIPADSVAVLDIVDLRTDPEAIAATLDAAVDG